MFKRAILFRFTFESSQLGPTIQNKTVNSSSFTSYSFGNEEITHIKVLHQSVTSLLKNNVQIFKSSVNSRTWSVPKWLTAWESQVL